MALFSIKIWRNFQLVTTFFEVKRKAENIDVEVLETKAAAFLRATGEFKGYALSYKGLSMADM